MTCPKCHSENVNVQMVSETELKQKKKRHGFLWRALIGWWCVPVWWLFFTLPALIVKMLRPKNYVTETKHIAMCVCQDCGHSWKAKKRRFF